LITTELNKIAAITTSSDDPAKSIENKTGKAGALSKPKISRGLKKGKKDGKEESVIVSCAEPNSPVVGIG